MGHLNVFNIPELIKKFNLINYVETGTGVGLTLNQALSFDFKSIHSIEMDISLYNDAVNKFGDPRLSLYKGLSREVLPDIMSFLIGNTFFFLDAHFPGSDFRTGLDYVQSVTYYGRDALPLKNELEIILKMRPKCSDVFLIDDLRIYENGEYETGNWTEKNKLEIEDSSFIYELFKNTHEIQINNKNQGYLLITPYGNRSN